MDVRIDIDARIAEAKLRGAADRLPAAAARGFLRGLDLVANRGVIAQEIAGEIKRLGGAD